MKKINLIIMIVILFASRGFTYIMDSGSSSMDFTALSAVARQHAIGESAINSSGLEGFYGNPATAIFAPFIDLSLNSAYFSEMTYGSANFIYPNLAIKGDFLAGISALYFNSGKLKIMDGDGTLIEDFSQNNFMLTGLASLKISDQFTIGANLKFAYQHLYYYGQFAFMADIGVCYITPQQSGFRRVKMPVWLRTITPDRLGLVFRNLGISTSFNDMSEPTPMEIDFGMLYYVLGNDLSMNFDFEYPLDSYMTFKFGAEYTFLYNYFVRLGYEIPFSADGQLWYSRLAMGFGFKFKKYKIDYTIVPFNLLGTQHYLSVSLRFSE